MKNIAPILFLLVIVSSCEEEDIIPIVREDLIGVWVNQSNGEDYLEFREWICLIDRGTDPENYNSIFIRYSYELWNDTLELRDNTDEAHVLYKCKLEFLDSEKQVLNIKGLENVPPFLEGENFEKLEFLYNFLMCFKELP
ncbi:MAG: hypothetical protein ABFS32_16615 [Bacteroidota bacterium]